MPHYQRRKIVTPAVATPVTLQEAKDHLRVDLTIDDTLITTIINIATEYAEKRLGRALITQTWDLYMDTFPNSETIPIPLSPLISITSVKYQDANNVEQTWAASNYDVDIISEPARVQQSDGGDGYPDTFNIVNAVVIRFVAGYGTASTDVPETIRGGIKLLISWFYENREGVLVGAALAQQIPLPKSMEAIWNQETINRTF